MMCREGASLVLFLCTHLSIKQLTIRVRLQLITIRNTQILLDEPCSNVIRQDVLLNLRSMNFCHSDLSLL